MRRLILLRHAKTETAGAGPDFDRRLLPRGREDARRLAEAMRASGLGADALVHSGAARAAETADIVARAWLTDARRRVEPRLYGASAREILRVVRELPASETTVVLVGHNPGMHEFAHALAGGGDPKLMRRLGEKLPTCGCVVIELVVDRWEGVEPGEGTLVSFRAPEAG